MLTVNIDRDKTARYGLNIGDVREASRLPPAARSGHLFQGDRRFDIVVPAGEPAQ